MTEGQQALYLAKYFYQQTGRRATPASMGMTVNQAKSLIKSGFTPREIEQGIDYCIAHPPKKGFTSLGWLSYDLENILIKVKAQQAKQGIDDLAKHQIIFDEFNETKTFSEKRIEDRVNKDFDFGMFEE